MKVDTNAKKIKEVLERGVEQVIKKEHLLHRMLSGQPLRIKLGIDPTAPDLHLGNAVVLWKLKAFQDLGHTIVLIIGDFTAKIGDPSGKLSERKVLSDDEIKKNMKTYRAQIGKILDLKKTEFVYNSKHLSKMSFAEMYRISHFFSANQILERDMFQKRKELGRPIWLHEFFYPIFQAYDSVAVQADVETGGSDQLFNMMMGRQLQPHFEQSPQDVLTMKILVGTDGTQKMSKSLGNYIGIQEKPAEIYGKIMSIRDERIIEYFELCTSLAKKEVEKIERALKNKSLHPRIAKAQLAREIVAVYHGARIAERAEEEFNRVFKEKEFPSEILAFPIKEKSIALLDILVKTKLATSKSEAKRLIEQGAVKIDSEIQKDWRKIISLKRGMVFQAGKRKFAKIG